MLGYLPASAASLALGLSLCSELRMRWYHTRVGYNCGNRAVCMVVSVFLGALSLHAVLPFCWRSVSFVETLVALNDYVFGFLFLSEVSSI